MNYKYKRTIGVQTEDRRHPFLLAYSNLIDRLTKLHEAGRLEYESMPAGGWARWTDPSTGKAVQCSDRMTETETGFRYSISVSFYQFENVENGVHVV